MDAKVEGENIAMTESIEMLSYFDVTDIPSECLVKNAKDFHQILVAALAGSTSLVVNCSDVTKMDISFVQILVSAHKSFTQSGRQFKLSNVTDCVEKTFAAAGLQDIGRTLAAA